MEPDSYIFFLSVERLCWDAHILNSLGSIQSYSSIWLRFFLFNWQTLCLAFLWYRHIKFLIPSFTLNKISSVNSLARLSIVSVQNNLFSSQENAEIKQLRNILFSCVTFVYTAFVQLCETVLLCCLKHLVVLIKRWMSSSKAEAGINGTDRQRV